MLSLPFKIIHALEKEKCVNTFLWNLLRRIKVFVIPPKTPDHYTKDNRGSSHYSIMVRWPQAAHLMDLSIWHRFFTSKGRRQQELDDEAWWCWGGLCDEGQLESKSHTFSPLRLKAASASEQRVPRHIHICVLPCQSTPSHTPSPSAHRWKRAHLSNIWIIHSILHLEILFPASGVLGADPELPGFSDLQSWLGESGMK